MRVIFSPVVMICIGGVLLANNFVPGFDIGRWWPLVVIGTGAGWLLERYCKRLCR